MANREKGGRVVFIGNIPYGVSEEQICEEFGKIGPVLNFRLVYDKETGKPKGFGFLEYGDVDAAASAVRNMNDFEIMGRRLKVDYSNDNSGGRAQRDGGAENQGSGRAPPPAHFNLNSSTTNGAPPQQDPNALPPLPPGAPLDPGMTVPDAISKTLNAYKPEQLLDILSQMKTLCMSEPGKATQLLTQAPQLNFAIFQALLLLGLVDPQIIAQLVQQQAPVAAPPPQPPVLPPYQQPPQAYAQPPPPNPYALPPQPQYNPYQQPQHPGYAPTPPAPQPAYQPPPSQPPAAVPQLGGGDQQALVAQILGFTREQIMAMDENTRNTVIQIRSQLGAPL